MEVNKLRSGGFTFCGIDISKFGLEYAPENKDTYVWNTNGFDIEEQSFAGHDGGYFYGSTLKPKIITIRCFYEQKHINSGLMSRINSFFRIGKTGKLVFEHRPWVYYMATVTNINYDTMYSYLNGLVIIQMKVYNPFALTDYTCISEDYRKQMYRNSAFLNTDPTTEREITLLGGTSEYSGILLYNAGTERADVTIDVGGKIGDHLLIQNLTNGTECKFIKLEQGGSSNFVRLDGQTGNCYWVNNHVPAFLVHDHGFITLDPAYPIERDIEIEVSGSSVVVNRDLTEDIIGKYIMIDGTPYKITAYIDENTFTIDGSIDELTDNKANIITMNEIKITTLGDNEDVYIALNFKSTFS